MNNKHYLLAIFLLCCIFPVSHSAYADDSCGFSSPQVEDTPNLCKKKSLDALLPEASSSPDFSDVDDILDGVRTVLPVQDFVLMNPTGQLPGQQFEDVVFIARDFFAFTENSSIVESEGPIEIVVNNCNPSITDNFRVPYGVPSPQQTNPARMFNLDRDVVVTFAANINANFRCNRDATVTIQDPKGLITIPDLVISRPSDVSAHLHFLHSTVADFNGDGYDDVLIARGGIFGGMVLITAVDPDKPEAGVRLGPFIRFPRNDSPFSESNLTPMSSPVAGDFNGDNIVDVAWVGSGTRDQDPYNIYFASICPGSTPDIPLCQGKSEFEVILNPLSSQIIPLDTFVNSSTQFSYPASALAAGEFSIINGDELVVIYGHVGGYEVEYYTFDDSMAPTFRDSISQPWVLWNAYADAAQFDLSKSGEQVAIAQQINNGCPLWLLDFDFNTNTFVPYFSDWSGPVSGSGNCDAAFRNPSSISLNGMTLGRFTSEEPITIQDLAPQIAIFLTNYQANGSQYRFFKINAPDDFFPRISGLSEFPNSVGTASFFGSSNPNRGGSFLKAGDLQGRSLELGTPDVARISNWLEVITIIGSPPMHTAYIQGLNQSEPLVNNFSVTPPTFTTGFTTGTSGTTSTTTTDRASWTYSFMQSIAAQAKFGPVPLVSAVEVKASADFNQSFDCNIESVNSSYSSVENVISTKTGFGDNIIYTESRKNIYFYPVIGRTVCPDGSDDCPNSEREPLYYQISAPDQISTNLVTGRTSEFYQPPHQPGNIMTYPASRNQLLSRFASNQANILSEPTLGFLTNNTPFTQIKQWNQGQGNQCTTDSTKTYSYNQSLSISAGTGIITDFLGKGLKVTAKFDFGQSNSIGSNVSSGTTTSDSIGIEVKKPNEFLDPDTYQYLVNSYILGQPFPDGVWQSLFNEGQTAANITNTGPLIVAFTSNMLSNDAGPWWESGGINPYLQYPDIGLNLPVRWRDVPVRTGTIIETPDECRLENFNSSTLTCTLIRKPPNTPGELWANGFYHMRGFFIQAGTDLDADAIAPSQTYVYIGDDLNLSTRVYNLSLKELAPTDVIRVQFYRQQWDNTLNVPIGNSILISEQSISPIPPFTDSDMPNWNLISTSLNTQEADMGPGKYWVFWVLVYGVDQNGNLVDELPGYGLDSSEFKPNDVFNSILDVPLEKVSIRELLENVERSFTNNVGFYKHAVYVAPQPSNLDDDVEPTIFVDNISVTPEQVKVGEEVILTADVYSMDAAADGVTVLFHDRHPDEAEIAYDMEILSNIEKDSLHNVQVTFQPEFCGEHELHISAADNGIGNEETDIISVILDVICQPGDTNLDGFLIGPNGQPIIDTDGSSGCTLAPAGTRAEFPFYLIVPLLFVAIRIGYRRINQ